MKTAQALSFLLFPSLCPLFTLRADVPTLLADALETARVHEGRWAYTQTEETLDAKGLLKEEVVFRYDPSKPYAEQYTPISINGKAPSKKVLREYRERGESEAREKQQLLEESGPEQALIPRINLGSAVGIADLDHATVTEETDHSVSYKIPVRGEGRSSFPFNRIQILIRVNKHRQSLENIHLSILAPFRIKLVAKVRQVEVSADYSPVDLSYPPQASKVSVHASGSLFFARFNEHEEIRRTDFKRVKPYDERFSVKAGPLKALGF